MQITNSKHQKTNKYQFPNIKKKHFVKTFLDLLFDYYLIFGIWHLEFLVIK